MYEVEWSHLAAAREGFPPFSCYLINRGGSQNERALKGSRVAQSPEWPSVVPASQGTRHCSSALKRGEQVERAAFCSKIYWWVSRATKVT